MTEQMKPMIVGQTDDPKVDIEMFALITGVNHDRNGGCEYCKDKDKK